MVDRKGKTALHLACEGGDMNTVTVLTQFLINTFGIDSWEVYTMLNAHDYQGKCLFDHSKKFANCRKLKMKGNVVIVAQKR